MFELYSTQERDGGGEDLPQDTAEPAPWLKVRELQGEGDHRDPICVELADQGKVLHLTLPDKDHCVPLFIPTMTWHRFGIKGWASNTTVIYMIPCPAYLIASISERDGKCSQLFPGVSCAHSQDQVLCECEQCTVSSWECGDRETEAMDGG